MADILEQDCQGITLTNHISLRKEKWPRNSSEQVNLTLKLSMLVSSKISFPGGMEKHTRLYSGLGP